LLKEDGLETRTCTLAKEVQIRLTKRQQELYKAINKAATKYKRHAKKCRKVHAGVVQWCLQVSRAIYQILYWKGMLSCKQGCAIGSSVLCARAKKARIDQHAQNFQLAPQDIQAQIRKAYKRFNQIKADPERRDTWIAGIIQVQAQAKGCKVKSLWKQHRAAEKARKTA